jgi:hypothetical protein
MRVLRRPLLAMLAVAGAMAVPGTAAAQFPPPPQGGSVQDRWPESPKPQQAQPAEAPAAKRNPSRPSQARAPDPDGAEEAVVAPPAHKPAPSRTPTNVVTCGGVFAKNTGHVKLAQRFDSRNIAYGQVEGPDGSKIPASILFPNDPKRRLEVLWSNEASRSDVSVIAINGKSQWIAPKGLKLGLPLAALEKMNGKPFKLTGFGIDNSASVSSWEGGALSSLPGGCKVGMRLMEDAKSGEALRIAVAGDKELLSNDAAVQAVRPTVGEILIGY